LYTGILKYSSYFCIAYIYIFVVLKQVNILVIVTHPNIEESKVNKSWINELQQHDGKVTIHQLYNEYPDLNIDLAKEQELLLSHDSIIIQFPLHWFNTPFLLKKWMDEVLTYGWAFGPGGDKLKGKKVSSICINRRYRRNL